MDGGQTEQVRQGLGKLNLKVNQDDLSADLSGSSIESGPQGEEQSNNTSTANASSTQKQSEGNPEINKRKQERNTFKLNLFKKKINLNREASFKFRVDQNSVNSGLEGMSGAHSSGSLQSEVDQLFKFRKENRDIGDRFLRGEEEGSGGINPRTMNYAMCFTSKIILENEDERKTLLQPKNSLVPKKKNSNEALNKWSGKTKFEIHLGKVHSQVLRGNVNNMQDFFKIDEKDEEHKELERIQQNMDEADEEEGSSKSCDFSDGN